MVTVVMMELSYCVTTVTLCHDISYWVFFQMPFRNSVYKLTVERKRCREGYVVALPSAVVATGNVSSQKININDTSFASSIETLGIQLLVSGCNSSL
jgi:hypothetical protein